jgi:hypothetical protein
VIGWLGLYIREMFAVPGGVGVIGLWAIMFTSNSTGKIASKYETAVSTLLCDSINQATFPKAPRNRVSGSLACFGSGKKSVIGRKLKAVNELASVAGPFQQSTAHRYHRWMSAAGCPPQ